MIGQRNRALIAFLIDNKAILKFARNMRKQKSYGTLKNYMDVINYGSPLRNFSGAFEWEKTPEKHEYWMSLRNSA